MNFYRHRPLALIITICVLASAAVYFLPGHLKVAFIALIAVLAPISVSVLKRCGVKVVCNISPAPFIFICATLTMVMTLISFVYFDVHVARYDALTKGSIKATVTSVESRTAYGAVYSVRMSARDGKAEHAKGFIAIDDATQFNIGDVIEADVEFCILEDFYSYREASRFELITDGVAFTANTVGEVRLCGEDNGIFTFLARLRERFSAKISLYLDKDSAPLADALFLGKRADLGKIKRDFTYIGAMHLLALSGLHLSIVAGGLERLLMHLGVGAKARYILTVLLAFFYVALTGFIPSATRAAIMLALVYTASFLDTDSDRVTSLFIAVGVIALFDPTAIFDVSLQLSFAATLGILLVAEPAKRLSEKLAPSGKSRTLLRAVIRIACGMVSSLGAIMFVLPLVWFYFGEASLMSVVATLVMTPICELLLVLIPPLLICSLFEWHSACAVIGGAVRAVSAMCADVAAELSEHSALVSLGYPFALPILVGCIAVIVYMAVRGCRNWLYALIPFAASVAVFLAGVGVYDAVNDGRVTVDMASSTSSEAITLTSKRAATVIFIGEGSSQTVYPTLDFLAKRNLTQIEALVLTSASRRHVNSVRKLLNYRKVKTVFVPIPQDEHGVYIAADIAELASEYGSQLVLYDRANGSTLIHGDVTVNIAKEAKLSRSVTPLTAITFTRGDTVAAYVGASLWEDARVWSLVNGSKYMIFGSCGPTANGAPVGTAPVSTDAVYVTDDELAEVIVPWLEGSGGDIIFGAELSFELKE